MRILLLGLVLLVSGGRPPDREELMEADRALARATELVGMTNAFLPALAENAIYLHPGAPLLRGRGEIRAYLHGTAPLAGMTWSPAFADVSADGLLGYTYGWTRYGDNQGKYLTCWRRSSDGDWQISAYVRTTPIPLPDPGPMPDPLEREPAAPTRGRSDAQELLRADSNFAALSVARGAKAAFLAFAAPDAMGFGSGLAFNEGRDAIGRSFDNFPAGAVLAWKPVAAEIAQSGDLGCTVGEAVIAAQRFFSKYLTIWKRQADGTWKFVADGGNARPAPATDTPPPED